MEREDFEKKIEHLTQEQIHTGSLSVIHSILVDKGIVTEGELRMHFLRWMKVHKLEKPESIES